MSLLSTKKSWPNNYEIHSCGTLKGCLCDPNAPLEAIVHRERLEAAWLRFATVYYCICLKSRQDRYLSSSALFHQYGLCRLVKYLRVERPDEEYCKSHNIQSRGRYGCWQSYDIIAALALQDNLETVGSFEDDIEMRDGFSVEKLESVAHDKEAHFPNTWDLFKFGQLTFGGHACAINQPCKQCSPVVTQSWMPSLFQTNSTQTHAIVWSKAGIQKIAATSYETAMKQTGEEWDIDQWMRFHHYVMLACYPQLIAQSDSPTSNTQNNYPAWLAWCRKHAEPKVMSASRKWSHLWDPVAYYWTFALWAVLAIVLAIVLFPLALAILWGAPTAYATSNFNGARAGAATPSSITATAEANAASQTIKT